MIGLSSRLKNLPALWHAAPRRWGHRWHAMCSYMAMFPPTIPHVFINWLTSPGDVVWDPFCGRGTTVLEACNLGRIGLGSDANPLSWILTSAKVKPPTIGAVKHRINHLRKINGRSNSIPVADEINAIFDPDVLAQLLWLRATLSKKSIVDRYLYAVLLGILHANARSDGSPRGLTISMPNTFSMAPRYVMKYKKTHHLKPPKLNVIDALEARIADLGEPPKGFNRGAAWLKDVTKSNIGLRRFPAPRLIFGSPPYLEVMKYGKLNWLRLWLLGFSPKEVDFGLFASSSLSKYIDFMCRAINRFQKVMSDHGRICLVIGDVHRPNNDINLAQAVADSCVDGTGLRVTGIIEDKLPTRHKVSRIWKERKGYATKVDRILILSGPKAGDLPKIPTFNW